MAEARLYGDLVRPKAYVRTVKGVPLHMLCLDKETGVALCSGSVGWTIGGHYSIRNFGGFTPKALCKKMPSGMGVGPRKVTSSQIPIPLLCKNIVIKVGVSARDCAGNRASKFSLMSPSSHDLVRSFVIPGSACKSVKGPKHGLCKVDLIQRKCGSSGACLLGKRLPPKGRTGGPSCDNPDENIDLSSHYALYKEQKNIDPNARVALMDGPYTPYATQLFASFGEKVAIIPRTFAPSILKNYPVFVLASGALKIQVNNRALKAALDGYVKSGGRFFVFAQAWGKEWALIPGTLKV